MSDALSPRRLRVERLAEPLGVDPGTVRFDWLAPEDAADQTAYHLRVARDPDALPDERSVWDSGVVESGDSTDVPYVGPRLDSLTPYYWTVRVRDGAGEWSAWSPPAQFETGVAEWDGEWLAPAGPEYESTPAPAPAFRTTFDVDASVERARLSVAVGGTADPRINGERITESALDPGVTDYEERVLASTYDVTDAVREGTNALAVVCGRERYAMTAENPWGWTQTPWQRDHPELLAELTLVLADGTERTVATGDDWRVGPTATQFDCLYSGDEYDAREAAAYSDPEFDAGEWATGAVVAGPDGEIVPEVAQPIEPVRTLAPESIEQLDDGSHVFDFGEMIAGWVRLSVDAPEGTEIRIEHGEKRDDDGSVPTEQSHFDVPFQTDTYVCAGGDESDEGAGDSEEVWEPRFSYKGFQHVQVHGLPDDPDEETITAVVAHNTIEVDSESEFESSDSLLNQIHDNTRRALLGNHHWMPTDTPAYEKHGWTGDAQLTAPTALYNFEMVPLYRKYIGDVADAQRDTGELPPFAPTSDWGYSDEKFDEPFTAPIPAWDAAYVLMPWWTYEYAGERDLLAEQYDGMRALVSYLDSFRDESGVLDEGLGDWFPPGHGEITWRPPEGPAITSTAYYYRMLEVLADAADLLGHDRHRDAYARRAEAVRDEFNDAFFDPGTATYATGEVEEYRQTSNVFPLAFDLVPEAHRAAVEDRLVEDVRDRHDGHLNTGILGTKYLLPVLCDAGHVDLAYRVATQRSYPSWGDWIEQGMTSLCEAWEIEARSHNHHMFGSVDEWFYRYLAGVRPAEPGFDAVEIDPVVPADLDAVEATVDTASGVVRSAWEQTDDGVRFEIEIPPGVDGVAHLPGDDPQIDGDAVDSADGAVVVGHDGDRTRIDFPAGEWTVHTR